MHRRATKLLFWTTLLMATVLGVPVATAQANLGAVVDAGGRQISAEEFKRDVVGKVMKGGGVVSTASGALGRGSVEMIYLSAGGIRGTAQFGTLGGPFGGAGGGQSSSVEGSWSIDDRERVCTSLRMGTVVLAPRCQYWYAYDNKYFLSDSDSDRSARLTSYAPQQ